MSSRLDSILTFVDELDSRSDKLLSTVHSSNKIIQNIISINDRITELDCTIDDVRDLMGDNTANLNEFANLYEKSFYLESNLHMNDQVTNQMSFEQLTNEFRYLMKKLEKNDKYSNATASTSSHRIHPAREPIKHDPPAKPELAAPLFPKLSHNISMANLKLKPIKCSSTSRKVLKKKSRYRLSGIYNINPIAYNEDANDTSFSPIRTPITSGIEFTSSNNTSLSSNIMQESNDLDKDFDVDTTATSPAEMRHRSNSLPETPSTNFEDIFKSTDFDEMLELSDGLEKLRLRRLDHFISCANLKRYDRAGTQTGTSGLGISVSENKDVEFDNDSSTINLEDHADFDNLSILSDVSYYSPDKQLPVPEESEIDFDSYDNFLRASRLNLVAEFPHILKKSNSHDSIFNNSTVVQSSSYKYHNPVETIRISTSKVSIPTLEKISFDSKEKTSPSKASSSTKLLNEVISRNDQILKPISEDLTSVESNKSTFSIFNFTMVSPKKARRGSTTTIEGGAGTKSNKSVRFQPSQDKIKDSFSRSLTDSFLSLMSKPPSMAIPNMDPASCDDQNSSPPISVKNEIGVKRLPVRIPRNDGYHSNLIIGPNNTRIINHGESSVFKRPLITRVSHNSLQDALSRSFN